MAPGFFILVYTEPCRSEPARDDGVSDDIDVEC